MGAQSDANRALRRARRELDKHHDANKKLLRAGDPEATEENERLQQKVIEAEQGASRLARFLH